MPIAIGRNGQNIKLASSVTAYTIDAVKKSEYEGTDVTNIYLDEIKGISSKHVEILGKSEIHTSEDFLETERNISISDKLTQDLGKEAPIIYFLTMLINLPIICLTFVKKRLVYQSYRKCKKEIKLIQEEIKHYE